VLYAAHPLTPEDRERVAESLARPVDMALSRIARGECPVVLRPVMEIRSDGVAFSSVLDVDVVLHTRRGVSDLATDPVAVDLGADAMRILAREAGLAWSTELIGRSPTETFGSRASVALIGAAAQVVRACYEGATQEAAVDTAITDLERFLAMERCVWTVRAPLTGISVADGPYQLTEDTKIRAADDDFKQSLWATHGPGVGQYGALSDDDAITVRRFDSIIELSVERERDAWPVMHVLAERVNQVLTALRVYGARQLIAPLLWVQGPPAIESFGRGLGSILQQDRSALERAWRTRATASIDAATAQEMRSWIARLSARPADDALTFAVQRFNLCDGRDSDDDRLVDAWIALEALFSTRRERGATAYRTALRMALLNGTVLGERQRIRDFVQRSSYRLRNEVVHGTPIGKRSKKHEPDEEIVRRTEDLLRDTLRRWVLAGYGDPAQVISTLEDQALGGGPSP
jgi:hypothetical protein